MLKSLSILQRLLSVRAVTGFCAPGTVSDPYCRNCKPYMTADNPCSHNQHGKVMFSKNKNTSENVHKSIIQEKRGVVKKKTMEKSTSPPTECNKIHPVESIMHYLSNDNTD